MKDCTKLIVFKTLGLSFVSLSALLVLGFGAIAETCVAANGASREGITICDLGVLPGGKSSFANAVSEDGSTIVGVSGSSQGDRAFLWTEEGGMISLGTLPGGSESQAQDVNADGSVIVGSSDTAEGQRAFIWTKETGMLVLDDTMMDIKSSARAVSADGTVVVGSTGGTADRRAFRWTNETGMKIIGTEELGKDSAALGVSDDGTTIVGRVDFKAFRWNEAQGIALMAPEESSVAFDASNDGTIIVGGMGPVYSKRKAVRWNKSGAGQDVYSNPDSLRSTALDISPEGKVIVGAIDRHTAYIKRHDEELTILGGLNRGDADFVSDVAKGSGLGGTIIVGSSTGYHGHRAVRWLLSE
ncbi:hypothetical protein [Phaeobacter gallaeciensis]|uniref:Extracellular repeat protein, HAF family n=1 Tax=Phaeobacter gallaeciensis TaxID=60890 RepID=A0AAC9Z911_9RHOB|nr:hypothetical protein [Phaeobacter gallaeciensis]AHD09375.1 putative extracellular repeat protein, HAF family [Phaeobacter gallaeciensis DSM 26640]ATE92638.1 putative extracellular repeat protein, HAF family [Phaeobacter gallaeciensis]ATE97540.1 putative extracellular repeat protein, HAF family [Phaeobacter gallaeciensis]ATF01303.1 putative extracellular repeat protein, HAF family [Phaeobacter gallaeciensis]ATF05683.1 putative extracellular repeat protein, HAF family [Phaeobacter gallaeciens